MEINNFHYSHCANEKKENFAYHAEMVHEIQLKA